MCNVVTISHFADDKFHAKTPVFSRLPESAGRTFVIGAASEQAYDPSPNLYDYAQTKAATMNYVKSLSGPVPQLASAMDDLFFELHGGPGRSVSRKPFKPCW
jgi:hypothetical protein